MTFRERYLETLLFGRPDRIPLLPGSPRESTLKAWRQQGLAEGENYYSALVKEIGVEPPDGGIVGVPVSAAMIPEFEPEILKHENGHYIIRDWMGAIVEISDRYDHSYIRHAKDFVTRKWHKFPVQNRSDWEKMKERYDPRTPARFRDDFLHRQRLDWDQRDVISWQVNGPFWQLREWCGMEGLCMLFLDDPDFVWDMITFWTDFVSEILEVVLEHAELIRFGISEDMAYKGHSMISPAMTREFLLPTYKTWVNQVRARGCRIIDMDSDGYVGELIPIWIEAGINVCSPIEVAAHNDIVHYRQCFGRKMGFVGGVDKRCIAAGGDVIRREIERIAPVVRDGGYIPGCDHGVPPDVSWPDFVHYARLLAKVTGWV